MLGIGTEDFCEKDICSKNGIDLVMAIEYLLPIFIPDI